MFKFQLLLQRECYHIHLFLLIDARQCTTGGKDGTWYQSPFQFDCSVGQYVDAATKQSLTCRRHKSVPTQAGEILKQVDQRETVSERNISKLNSAISQYRRDFQVVKISEVVGTKTNMQC